MVGSTDVHLLVGWVARVVRTVGPVPSNASIAGSRARPRQHAARWYRLVVGAAVALAAVAVSGGAAWAAEPVQPERPEHSSSEAPKVEVGDVRLSYRPSLDPRAGAAEVTATIRNPGSEPVDGTYAVAVGGPLGLWEQRTAPVAFGELDPGEVVEVSGVVDGVPGALLVSASVHVLPDAGDGDDPLDPTEGSTIAGASAPALPPVVVALAALVLITLVVRHVRFARRDLRHGSTGDDRGGEGRGGLGRDPSPRPSHPGPARGRCSGSRSRPGPVGPHRPQWRRGRPQPRVVAAERELRRST